MNTETPKNVAETITKDIGVGEALVVSVTVEATLQGAGKTEDAVVDTQYDSEQLGKDISALDDDTRMRKSKDVKEMIRYYNALTNAVEDRLMKMHTFSLQTLAAAIALIGIVFANRAVIVASLGRTALFCLSAILTLFCLASILSELFHYSQAQFPYCFKKLNAWKWFYHGNPHIKKMSANPIFPSKKTEGTTEPYNAGLSYFLHHYLNETADSELSDDLHQLYLLQVHNHFKNRFFLQISTIWKWCFVLVFLVITFIVPFSMCANRADPCDAHGVSVHGQKKPLKCGKHGTGNEDKCVAQLAPRPLPATQTEHTLAAVPVVSGANASTGTVGQNVGSVTNVSLKLSASRSSIQLGESFNLTIEVNGADRGVDMPDVSSLPQADVLFLGQHSNSRSSITIINGRMTRETFEGRVFSYKLTPKSQGEYHTGPVRVIVSGKMYTHPGVTVEVIRDSGTVVGE